MAEKPVAGSILAVVPRAFVVHANILAIIALALEVEQEMAGLFSDVPYLSIDEVLHEQK